MATTTFEYSVRDRAGKLSSGKLEADSAGRSSPPSSRRWATRPISITEANTGHEAARSSIPGFGDEGQAQGPGDHVAAVRDDDQLRSVAAARADASSPSRPRARSLRAVLGEVRTDVETGTALSQSRWPSTPEGLPAAHGQHDRGRRGRRFPRPRPAADRGELRGRGQAARQGQVGDDLPGRRLRHGDPHVSSACCCSSSRGSRKMFTDLGGKLPAPTQILIDAQHHHEVVLPRLARRS